MEIMKKIVQDQVRQVSQRSRYAIFLSVDWNVISEMGFISSNKRDSLYEGLIFLRISLIYLGN